MSSFTVSGRIGTSKKAKALLEELNDEGLLNSLDAEAKKIGVTRQSIIKVWIAERLKVEAGQPNLQIQ